MSKLYQTLITVLLALMLGAPAMAAEHGEGKADGGQMAEPAADFSDAQLESFIAAAMELRAIRQEWAPLIKNAEDEAQAERLRAEGIEEMKAAVIDQGISPETYNQIGQAVQNSPELQQRLNTMVQNMQPQGGGQAQ